MHVLNPPRWCGTARARGDRDMPRRRETKSAIAGSKTSLSKQFRQQQLVWVHEIHFRCIRTHKCATIAQQKRRHSVPAHPRGPRRLNRPHKNLKYPGRVSLFLHGVSSTLQTIPFVLHSVSSDANRTRQSRSTAKSFPPPARSTCLFWNSRGNSPKSTPCPSKLQIPKYHSFKAKKHRVHSI